MIAATASEAEAKGEVVRQRRNMPREHYDSYFVAGDPDAVAQQARAYLDAGLDGLIFNVNEAADLERIELAGKTLSSIV
jgi:alkanesulfonate monooxygenase SsuD/methylene tetrahydromethanopterin reductase-like flavin-dependent oxidoreductase (luciferase family)